MRFFHSTTETAAERILAEGFRDRTGSHGCVGIEVTGVWLSDVPVDANEGAQGDVLLVVDLDAAEPEVAEFEVVEEAEQVHREWVMPAAFINTRGSVHTATEAELEDGSAEWSRRAERILRSKRGSGCD